MSYALHVHGKDKIASQRIVMLTSYQFVAMSNIHKSMFCEWGHHIPIGKKKEGIRIVHHFWGHWGYFM